MELVALIEAVLDRSLTPAAAPTEADYHALWLEHDVNASEPFVTAALGGALADRLAWVFVAGYQATIRRCFPELPREAGWCAFVNTEDASGTLPGTSLTGDPGGRRLSGWKTWLAMADHVERLIVSARHNELPFIAIRRDQPGLSIEGRRAGGYLSEMVQGRVRFDDVAVREDQILGDERTFPAFRASESAYVRAALSAFMFSHARRLDGPPQVIAGALSGLLGSAAMLDLPLPSRAAAVGMLGVTNHSMWLASEFESLIAAQDEVLHALWTKDRRLVDGASSGATWRALQALGVASES